MRITIEQDQGSSDRMVHENFATLIFLEGIDAASDQISGCLLRQPCLLLIRRTSSGSNKPSALAFSRLSLRSETFISSPV